MFKRFSILALALLISVTNLMGDNKKLPATDQALYSGGFVIGPGFNTLDSLMSVVVGYYGPSWIIDVGANYSFEEGYHESDLFGHLGLRNRLRQNLFISYGFMGFGDIGHSPWSVGIFTGLEYQISKHFLISGKIYPYNYTKDTWFQAKNNIFSDGTIGLFYVF